MSRDFASRALPEARSRSLAEWVSMRSWWNMLLWGGVLYVAPIVFCTIIENVASQSLVVDGNGARAKLLDLLYFNFITILTVGYGDFHPEGIGRLLSVSEAVYGVGLFGLILTALATKLLSPRADSLVFSKFAYYCTEDERFLLIFVNTTDTIMANVDMSWYFKLGGDWPVTGPIRAPFITRSVQTFFLGMVPLQGIVEQLKDGDVLRFGISASLGFSTYSTAVQYHADEIIVLPNREELTAYGGFSSPDFRTDISEMFHYRPGHAPTLAEYVAAERGT